MPEDSKKNQLKCKYGSKEQRKPRQARQQAPVEKKGDTKTEKPYVHKTDEPIVPGKPPVYEDPGPEFYKNLKRETDEILKITEEANSKYKKKEIQSNWSKYEIPIKSYDEVEEENLGADYEKLIQAPHSIGGHFQFKHEKSWDIDTGPSLYDKYFEINMDNLATALSTIPFYERNSIEHSLFSQTDLQTMNSRSIKYKQKYFNDKSYTTAELDAQDKILSLMKENVSKYEKEDEEIEKTRSASESKDIVFEDPRSIETESEGSGKILEVDSLDRVAVYELNKLEEKDDKHRISVQKLDKAPIEKLDNKAHDEDELDEILGHVDSKVDTSLKNVNIETKKTVQTDTKLVQAAESGARNPATHPQEKNETKGNSVIESPEELEKWLDDFLDG